MLVRVQVKTRSHASSVVYDKVNDLYLVSVPATPHDGKANEEVVAIMAREFGLAKSLVTIKSGLKSTVKMVNLNK